MAEVRPDEVSAILRKQLAGFEKEVDVYDVGTVLQIGDGVARVYGLSKAMMSELVEFPHGVFGMVLNLEEDNVGCILFGESNEIREGDTVKRTGRVASMPVGEQMLGRVINPLGQPVDGRGPISTDTFMPIERKALGVIQRQPVKEPLQTGIKAVDGMIPIGRGQRELIIGDRQTGKTAIAIDAIINQKHTHTERAKREGVKPVYCIYVAVGQKSSTVAQVMDKLQQEGAMDYTTIIAATASDPAPMQFIAPYSGATLGEFFRDSGRHALVVYDDLSKQAQSYRQVSLLLRRPPGREAYPGDVFYLHAELLERAAARRATAGGGSVTALPIVETTEGDLAAYIPTNVISITDGQIHLDTGRFERNERPAVDVGRSVSRIGGAAQPPAMRLVARNLRVLHARFEQLEALVRVGLEIDPAVEREIARGRILRSILRQAQGAPRGIAEQVVALLAVSDGWLDRVATDDASRAIARIIDRARAQHPAIFEALDAGRVPDGEWQARLRSVAAETLGGEPS
jgi:F-type H+-transporting ATPase subunit alpha